MTIPSKGDRQSCINHSYMPPKQSCISHQNYENDALYKRRSSVTVQVKRQAPETWSILLQHGHGRGHGYRTVII